MERAVSADSRNIFRVCKDRTTEDAQVVQEKAMKATKLKTVHSCQRTLFGCCARPHGIYDRANQIMDMAKKEGG